MLNFFKKNNLYESNLYNKILFLSRNKLFYTDLKLNDTFQNRINLIFIHISFLFIKGKLNKEKNIYKNFYQKMFNFTFDKIEINMREIGYGDTKINKLMKNLVKIFYNILLDCEIYNDKNNQEKSLFLLNYLTLNKHQKTIDNIKIIDYFNKYQAFCFDLGADSVLKGNLNFKYNKSN